MIGQTSAIDPAQLTWAEEQERRRQVRVAELWRWALTQRLGRAFLYEVVLADLGYLRHIRTHAADALYGDAALHNQACRWMAQIGLHRDLSLQMFAEASKREDEERAAEETKRREWEQRQQAE